MSTDTNTSHHVRSTDLTDEDIWEAATEYTKALDIPRALSYAQGQGFEHGMKAAREFYRKKEQGNGLG